MLKDMQCYDLSQYPSLSLSINKEHSPKQLLVFPFGQVPSRELDSVTKVVGSSLCVIVVL